MRILIWPKLSLMNLGVKLEIFKHEFDNVLTSLQTGKADLAVAGISATDERKEVFEFFQSLTMKTRLVSWFVRLM